MTAEVLAVIPARGGSKSIPRKNIKLMAGYPLLAYSIVVGIQAKNVSRVIVSTEDEEIAAIAREWGGDVPFFRPEEIAQDHSTDLQAFTHALEWLEAHENYRPDVCVHLRPTYPIRLVDDIDLMVQTLLDHPEANSIRSVAPLAETPFKMWFLKDNDWLAPVVTTDIQEAHSQPRQLLPQAYIQNACIDVIWTRTILEKKSMSGQRILGYVMDHNYDIDTEAQFQRVERILIEKHPGLLHTMRNWRGAI